MSRIRSRVAGRWAEPWASARRATCLVLLAAANLTARGSPGPAPPSSGNSGAAGVAVARPSLRERWRRHPPNLSIWVGLGALAFYAVAAASAVGLFGSDLAVLPTNLEWINPQNAVAPSLAHPFGVMPGLGTGLFRAEWQATPWDLGIVAGILAIDITIGLLLGAYAGTREGGIVDGLVTFVGDSIGCIPTFFFVIIVFAGISTVSPASAGIPLFVVIFGLVLWPTMTRTVRDRARSVAHEPYVEASRASGATRQRLLFRHILPNSLGPVLAQIPLDLAPIFFVLSAFPWYYNCAGFGPPPPPPGSAPGGPYLVPQLPPFSPLPSAHFPEWGYLLGVGTCEGVSYPGQFSFWWMYFVPLAVIVVFGLSVGLLCDGVERWRRLHR